MMENLLSSDELAFRKQALTENYKSIRERMENAALKAGRNPTEITLLAATKTVPVELINYGISIGIQTVGENKVQEFLSKYGALDQEHSRRHFIGHLQTNKVRQIVGKVELIQSVDSVKLAREISICSLKEAVNTGVLVEVNIGCEENKSGVAPQSLLSLLHEISGFEGISVRGLMAIPPICEKSCEIRAYFAQLRKLFIDIAGENIHNVTMDILSMGMSGDFEEAIEEGATMVRVGSSLFGARNYAVNE